MKDTKRKLLCKECLQKIRDREAEEKRQYRRLKIKVVEPAISGKIKINKN